MKKHLKPLMILAAITLFLSACGTHAVQAQEEMLKPVLPKTTSYQAILGKPLNDKDVAEFIASNYCSGDGQFNLCPSLGLAFWVDPSQQIKTVYLYAAESSQYAAYRGELPFSLTMRDTRAQVEQKLGQPKVEDAPEAGWEPGLPDEGGSPDHTYYWAIYKRFGLTIIYNSPSADDRNATIYTIVINK